MFDFGAKLELLLIDKVKAGLLSCFIIKIIKKIDEDL